MDSGGLLGSCCGRRSGQRLSKVCATIAVVLVESGCRFDVMQSKAAFATGQGSSSVNTESSVMVETAMIEQFVRWNFGFVCSCLARRNGGVFVQIEDRGSTMLLLEFHGHFPGTRPKVNVAIRFRLCSEMYVGGCCESLPELNVL